MCVSVNMILAISPPLAQSPSSTSKEVTTRMPPQVTAAMLVGISILPSLLQRSEVTLDKAYVEYCTEDRHRLVGSTSGCGQPLPLPQGTNSRAILTISGPTGDCYQQQASCCLYNGYSC